MDMKSLVFIIMILAIKSFEYNDSVYYFYYKDLTYQCKYRGTDSPYCNFEKGVICYYYCDVSKSDNSTVTVLSDSMFGEFLNMETIVMKKVGIQQIDSVNLTELNYLRELDLSYNTLTRLDAHFLRSSSLEKLNLEGNRISRVHLEAFSKLGSLTHLDLSHNHLTAYTAVKSTSELINLDLSANRLKKISFFAMPALQKLNLSGNELDGLRAGIFKRLTELETLDLSHNVIRSIQIDQFNGLAKLKHLNLAHNRLREIGTEHLNLLTSLTFLGLGHNRLSDLAIDSVKTGTEISIGGNQFQCDKLEEILIMAKHRGIAFANADYGDRFEEIDEFEIKCSSVPQHCNKFSKWTILYVVWAISAVAFGFICIILRNECKTSANKTLDAKTEML